MGEIQEISPDILPWASLDRSALDTEGETASRGAVDLQIIDVGMSEQFLDDRLEFPIRHVFLGQKAAAARVGFNRARASAKLLWKSGVLRIARAIIRVNIDRAGLGIRFDAGESIIGKKNS